jgi:hypothetical protein
MESDYMRVPEDKISDIKVLLTMVGGKVAYLAPSLAQEIGMQPVGPQAQATEAR